MATHNYIYLGRERGKRVVHKVGQTTQTCWARCKNSDYLIGVGIDIIFPIGAKWYELDFIENEIIWFFQEQFPLEHGREYFRTKGHNWEATKKLFLAKMIEILDKKGYAYEIHEGWVAPNTY